MYTSNTNKPTKFEFDVLNHYRDTNDFLNIKYRQIGRKQT